jgi:hypothetical protein
MPLRNARQLNPQSFVSRGKRKAFLAQIRQSIPGDGYERRILAA